MERLTTNKPVEEMNMTELARNSCYAKDGYAWYRDFETDIDARELARDLMLNWGFFELDSDEMLSDEIFDETMMDNLQYGSKEIEGLIALFYRNLWAMADLHSRLKAYEEAEERRINPGDTVYVMDEERDGVREYSVSKVTYGKYHDVVRFVGGSRFTVWGREWDEYLDKYLFKNKEEAEQALARMEDNNGKHEN